jgi:putative ABC transport system substrate-binding protein
MRRREFIIGLSGGAIFLFGARAQQAIPVIGFLHPVSAAPFARFVAAFREGLAGAGYVEGQNVAIEYRWAEGRGDRLPILAAELVQRGVNVIVTPGNTNASLAAKAATATIPIVFGVADDPVKFGLVESLARPGGNATGINYLTAELVSKRFGLLRELVPSATRIAVLINPADVQTSESTRRDAQSAAAGFGLQVEFFEARTSDEIDTAFDTIGAARPHALFVGPGAFFNARRVQLSTLAARHAIPAAYSVRDYAEAGGLMSYGTNIADMFRQVGVYTARVLKGEKPADLPVVQAVKFEFVINLRTARSLKLAVPQSILVAADEVIE